MKDLFAKAEHDLRQFTISPEEERDDVISSMIENHRKFQISLLENESKINNFQQFGHEILARAYPDAEKPIKHYINIIKSQWSEVDYFFASFLSDYPIISFISYLVGLSNVDKI